MAGRDARLNAWAASSARCDARDASCAKPCSASGYTTHTAPVERIQPAVPQASDLRPAAIVEHLDLLRPIYRPTAAYGHFGRTTAEGVEGAFTWERLDRVDELRSAV